MLALCSLIYMFIQVVDLAFLPASADYALVAAYTYLTVTTNNLLVFVLVLILGLNLSEQATDGTHADTEEDTSDAWAEDTSAASPAAHMPPLPESPTGPAPAVELEGVGRKRSSDGMFSPGVKKKKLDVIE